jgi:hypothetical protein
MNIYIALPFIVAGNIAMGFVLGKMHERFKWNILLNSKNPKNLAHVKTMAKGNIP